MRCQCEKKAHGDVGCRGEAIGDVFLTIFGPFEVCTRCHSECMPPSEYMKCEVCEVRDAVEGCAEGSAYCNECGERAFPEPGPQMVTVGGRDFQVETMTLGEARKALASIRHHYPHADVRIVPRD